MLIKRSITLCVIALLIGMPASGQTPASSVQEAGPVGQNQEDAVTKLNAQAFDLLDSVIKDIDRLRVAQNRTYLSISAGELLWQHDEPAARALFKSAMADLRAILSEPLDADAPRSNREKMERSQLREKVLMALARHDARMARDFLAETRPAAPQNTEYQPNYEAEFESRLALVIAANDPAQALDMAQKILAKGFTGTLPNLLSDIQKKDREAAAQLASDILAKLKTVSLNTNQEAANVAVRVFQMGTEPENPNAKPGAKDGKPLLTEQSLRDLAELIVAAALDTSAESAGRRLNFQSVITQLEKYAPSRAQQLRKMIGSQSGEGGEEEPWRKFQKLSESGTVETILVAAESNPEMSEGYYRLAALKLVNEDKSDRARQLITEHITDPGRRQQILAELDKAILTAAASQGKIEETRKFLSRASTNEERILLLAQLATSIAQKGDKKTALQILEEARGLSAGRVRYSRQFIAQIQIARAYAFVDPAQSLSILETSIDQLNELIAAGILLGEFLGEEEVMRDDELLIFNVFELAVVFQQQFGKDLALLSSANFTRTRDAAERFQRFEVRIMTRLLVVQSVLSLKEGKAEELLKTTEPVKPVPVSP